MIQTEPFKLGHSNLVHILLMTRGRTPIDFQGQGSKVKVTRYTLLLNLVNTIQTEPFQLGPSNFVHLLLMSRLVGTLLMVMAHGVKVCLSHATHLSTKLVDMIQTEQFQLGPVKLGTNTTYDRRMTPIDFQGQGSKVGHTLHIVVKPCKHDTD